MTRKKAGIEAAVAALRQKPPMPKSKGSTTQEIAHAMEVSQVTAYRMLREAIAVGRMEYAGKEHRLDITGAPKLRPVFRLAPKGCK